MRRRPRSIRRRAGSPRECAWDARSSAGLVVDPARAPALAQPLSADLASNGDAVTRAPMLEPRLHDLFPDAGDVASRRSPPEAAVVPAFTDDAMEVGLRFVHERGGSGEFLPPPETMSGGVGLLDYDGDGWLDVYAVQGGPFPPGASAHGNGDRLFHNRGDGTFEDVTERAGVAAFPAGYGHGVAVGDVDNDGRPDLFVTRWRSVRALSQQG